LKLAKNNLGIGESTSIRKRIEEDLVTISSNAKYSTCWFCGNTLSNARSSINVAMYGNVQKEWGFLGTKVRWQKIEVPVPRCRKCENAHNARTRLGCGGAIIGLISGILLGIALQDEFHGVIVALVAFAIISIIGYIISLATFPLGIKSESHKNNFPTMQEMLEKGWKIGDKPS